MSHLSPCFVDCQTMTSIPKISKSKNLIKKSINKQNKKKRSIISKTLKTINNNIIMETCQFFPVKIDVCVCVFVIDVVSARYRYVISWWVIGSSPSVKCHMKWFNSKSCHRNVCVHWSQKRWWYWLRFTLFGEYFPRTGSVLHWFFDVDDNAFMYFVVFMWIFYWLFSPSSVSLAQLVNDFRTLLFCIFCSKLRLQLTVSLPSKYFHWELNKINETMFFLSVYELVLNDFKNISTYFFNGAHFIGLFCLLFS